MSAAGANSARGLRTDPVATRTHFAQDFIATRTKRSTVSPASQLWFWARISGLESSLGGGKRRIDGRRLRPWKGDPPHAFPLDFWTSSLGPEFPSKAGGSPASYSSNLATHGSSGVIFRRRELAVPSAGFVVGVTSLDYLARCSVSYSANLHRDGDFHARSEASAHCIRREPG